MKQIIGFKFRFYPTSSQRLQLAQTFGCSRFVYNWGLNLRSASYKEDGKSISFNETSNQLTQLKKEESTKWLKDVSSVTLQQSLKHLDTAFKRFFKQQGKYPKFKKRRNRQSATYQANAFCWSNGNLTLAKMNQPLNIKWSRRFNDEPKQVTVSKDPSGRYFVSFLVEEELEQWKSNNSQVGLDLGITDVIVSSKGFASGNPKYLKKYQARLKKLQRRLKNKVKGSNRRRKAVQKVAKIHALISDSRKDFLNKLTTKIVRENQTIAIESLNIKGMMANHKLAKAIADCPKGYRFAYGWGELIRQLEYKCQWHNRVLIKIDQWFPSSKTCNNCGFKIDKLPLSQREWDCPNCNHHQLRDFGAAINILGAGLALLARGASTNGELINLINSSYDAAKRESSSFNFNEA